MKITLQKSVCWMFLSFVFVCGCSQTNTKDVLCYQIQEGTNQTLLKLDLNSNGNTNLYNHNLTVLEFENGKEVVAPFTIAGRIADNRYFIYPDGSTFEFSPTDYKLAPAEMQNSSLEIKSSSPSPMAGLVFLKTDCR